MVYKVLLTGNARRDLHELYDYLAEHDSAEKADRLLENISEVLGMLSQYPERGNYPKELLAWGIRDYREVFFKPYRLIYRVRGKIVYVQLIVDGRRDMVKLFQKRLFGN